MGVWMLVVRLRWGLDGMDGMGWDGMGWGFARFFLFIIPSLSHSLSLFLHGEIEVLIFFFFAYPSIHSLARSLVR